MSEAQTNASPSLLDAHEAAQRLGISERTLWALSAPRGRLPIVRIGRLVRYRQADLEAFIAGQIQR